MTEAEIRTAVAEALAEWTASDNIGRLDMSRPVGKRLVDRRPLDSILVEKLITLENP